MRYGCLWALYFAILLPGWIINVVNVMDNINHSSELSAQFVLQVAGILLFPLGTVLGYAI